MRWERLFDDLEAEVAAQERAALDTETAERTRIEVGRIELAQRLRAAQGAWLIVAGFGALQLRGRLEAVGPDWLLVVDPHGSEHLVAAAMVTSYAGLPLATGADLPAARVRVFSRLDLRHALRGMARDRAAVQLLLADATALSGTIDRVGADFIDLAEHPAGEPRRAGAVREFRAIPLGAIVSVRT